MKVNVLITTYNLVNYVDETLQSVLNQKTDFPFEILVGDDGSDDGTIEAIQKWQESYPGRIELYVMDREPGKKYNGIARASRNRLNLLQHATGEYLIFLDGDDRYTDPYKLAKQVAVLDAPENQDCVACGHNIRFYWGDRDERNYLMNDAKDERKIPGEKYWKYGMYLSSDTLMFRNVFRDGVPKNLHPEYFDDNIIAYCLLPYGKIYYLPDAMVDYRQLPNSNWNSVQEMEKHMINIMDVDIEKRLNPKMYHASVMRHMFSIFYIWSHGKEMTPELYQKRVKQAVADQLSWCKEWFDYPFAGVGTKLKKTVWLMWQMCQFLFIKVKKRRPENHVNP